MTRIAVVAGLVRVAAFLAAMLLPAQTLVANDEVSDEPQLLVQIIAVVGSGRSEQHPATNVSLEMGVGDERDALGEPLLSVRTDEFGFAFAHIPWSALEPSSRGKRPLIWVRSQGLGLLVRIAKVRAPEPSPRMFTVNAVVQPGAVVEGVMLGPNGEPVAGDVRLVRSREGGSVGIASLARAGSDGRFRGEVLHEGPMALFARGSSDTGFHGRWTTLDFADLNVGSGFSSVIDVRFAEAVPFVEIDLEGPGVLQGRVRDREGRPAAAMSLKAVLIGDARGQIDPSVPEETLEEFMVRRAGGDIEAKTRTDAQGAFRLTGLREGLYELWDIGGRSFEDWGYSQIMTDEPVPSDGSPLELELTRPHLAVHVSTADGSVPTDEFGMRGLGLRLAHGSWPKTVALMVSFAPAHPVLGGWGSPYLSGPSTIPGEFIVPLGDLRSVDVGIHGGAVPWRPLRVAVPEDAGRIDVNLVIPEPVAMGTLILDVQDSAGEAVTTGLRARLLGPQSGVVLLEEVVHYSWQHLWPLRWTLPEGQYRLVVEGQAKIDYHHGNLMNAREHGAFDGLIEISPGAETRLTAKLQDGARLRLRLIGETELSDRALMRARDAFAPDDEIEARARVVTLHLERAGRWPQALNFSQPEGGLASTLALGNEATSEVLTPGTYTLVATMVGGRTVRRALVLQPGETSFVILQLD